MVWSDYFLFPKLKLSLRFEINGIVKEKSQGELKAIPKVTYQNKSWGGGSTNDKKSSLIGITLGEWQIGNYFLPTEAIVFCNVDKDFFTLIEMLKFTSIV